MTVTAGLFCLGCALRAEEFSSAELLWATTLEVNPDSSAAHNNLGLAYQEHSGGDRRLLGLAEAQFRTSLDCEYHLDSAGVNLANVLRVQGRWTESADMYRTVLDAKPDAESYNNYGVALLKAGDNPKARDAFRDALRLDPSMVSAYYNLYGIEQAEHHVPQAFAALRACLRINPDHVPSLDALVLLGLGQPDQPPPTPAAAEMLVVTAERACQLTQYRHPQSLIGLSKSLVAAGRPDDADRAAAHASEVAAADGRTDLVAAIEEYRRPLGR